MGCASSKDGPISFNEEGTWYAGKNPPFKTKDICSHLHETDSKSFPALLIIFWFYSNRHAEYKLVIVGDIGVGKTTAMHRFTVRHTQPSRVSILIN